MSGSKELLQGGHEDPLTIDKELQNRSGITVVKIGGRAKKDRKKIIKIIAAAYRSGLNLVGVHGGGTELDDALNEKTEKPDGIRYTTANTLAVATGVFYRIKDEIVDEFALHGVQAKGYTPASRVLWARYKNKAKYGLVGEISQVQTGRLQEDMSNRVLSILSPIARLDMSQVTGIDWVDQVLEANVNADEVAIRAGKALKAKRVIFVSDVPGLLKDGVLIPKVSFEECQDYLTADFIKGGMIPKVAAAYEAIKEGMMAIMCDTDTLPDVLAGKPGGTTFYPTSN